MGMHVAANVKELSYQLSDSYRTGAVFEISGAFGQEQQGQTCYYIEYLVNLDNFILNSLENGPGFDGVASYGKTSLIIKQLLRISPELQL